MDLQSIARAGFLALAGLFLGASHAQQPSRTPRIGILMNGPATNNVAMEVVKAGVCLSLHEFQDDREPALYPRIGYVECDRRAQSGYERVFYRKRL